MTLRITRKKCLRNLIDFHKLYALLPYFYLGPFILSYLVILFFLGYTYNLVRSQVNFFLINRHVNVLL